MRAAFETIKKIFKEDYVSGAKKAGEKDKTLQRSALCSVIERLFARQLRQSFRHLHQAKEVFKAKASAVGGLEGLLLRLESRQKL